MRFYSIVSNISYEVTPDHWEYHGPDARNREKVRGITARFSSHMYDTKAQQELNGWDDETREMVENYLKNHENYDTSWLQSVPETEAESKAKEFVNTNICISRTVTDEGVVDCDQQAVDGEFYCKRHLPVGEPVRS